MKTAVALLLGTMTGASAADDVGRAQAFARYAAMMDRSPFGLATAVPRPPEAPNFPKDLYIASVAWSGDDCVVTLASNVDKNLKEHVTTKARSKNGFRIIECPNK